MAIRITKDGKNIDYSQYGEGLEAADKFLRLNYMGFTIQNKIGGKVVSSFIVKRKKGRFRGTYGRNNK